LTISVHPHLSAVHLFEFFALRKGRKQALFMLEGAVYA
jgi:hypothetical protein